MTYHTQPKGPFKPRNAFLNRKWPIDWEFCVINVEKGEISPLLSIIMRNYGTSVAYQGLPGWLMTGRALGSGGMLKKQAIRIIQKSDE